MHRAGVVSVTLDLEELFEDPELPIVAHEGRIRSKRDPDPGRSHYNVADIRIHPAYMALQVIEFHQGLVLEQYLKDRAEGKIGVNL